MRLKKLIISVLLIISVSLTCINVGAYTNRYNGEALGISANGAILIDVNTESILYKKNIDEQCRPASLTKMMTLLVAYGKLKNRLSEEVTLTAEMIEVPADSSNAALLAGDRVKINDLFYMMMLPSGNDAARALAYIVSGNEPDFAVLMNEKAKELGMNSSQFKNAHGFDEKGHYTTTYDLAVLAETLCKDEDLVKVFSTVKYTANIFRESTGSEATIKYTNTNNMINPASAEYFDGCKGIKTGFTASAGNCLASYYEKDGRRLIAVVTKSDVGQRDNDMRALFKFGINNYDSFDVGEIFAQKTYIVDVSNSDATDEANGQLELYIDSSEPKYIIVSATEGKKIRALQQDVITVRTPTVSAPVREGDNVGIIEFTYNGETIYSAPALAARSIDKDISSPMDLVSLGIHGKLRLSFAFLLSPFFYVPVILIIVVAAVVLGIRKMRMEKRRKIRRRQRNVAGSRNTFNNTRPGSRV